MSHRRDRRARAGRLALGLLAASWAAPRGAQAYDPATSHAGLTEQSVLASGLHKVLARRLARPLGLFEPVVLRAADLPVDQARALQERLATLDPAGGYRPADNGAAPAMAWVVAGAVIAQTPSERGRNSFYDPSRGAGLGNAGNFVSFTHALRLLLDGGSFRAVATGTDFNLTGLPATAWVTSPANDVGLAAFYPQLEAAVSAADPGRRNTALARALLALGGTLAVLQDAGEPAHVRNDFEGAFLDRGEGSGPFDRGSAFERFVAERYGRTGIPAPVRVVTRPTLMAFLTAADAQGLADRTQRRFFSAGTLPEDAVVDRETTPAQVMQDVRESLRYGLPTVPRLELRAMGQRRYVYANDDAANAGPPGLAAASATEGRPPSRRLLGYQRVPGRVRFFLDAAVYGDTARAWLPEIGAYGAGLIDHLFRGELSLTPQEGGVTVALQGARGPATGQVRLFVEDARGQRRQVGSGVLSSDGSARISGAVPSGTRRLAAVLRGQDGAGELLVVGEQAYP